MYRAGVGRGAGRGRAAPPVVAADGPADRRRLSPRAPRPRARARTGTAAPPYSLPWQLRPVTAANVVRSDTAVSFYENGRRVGQHRRLDPAALLQGAAPLGPDAAAGVRAQRPGRGAGIGQRHRQPAGGRDLSLDLAPGLRMGLFLGVTVPIGQGATSRRAWTPPRRRRRRDQRPLGHGQRPVRGELLHRDPRRRARLHPGRLHRPGRGDAAAADPRAQLGHREGLVPHQLHQRPAPGLLHHPPAVGRRRAALPALAVRPGLPGDVPGPARDAHLRRRPARPLQARQPLAAPGASPTPRASTTR